MNSNRSVAGLLEYILKHQPKAESLGADEFLIARFEQTARRLTGFSLPADYLEFLQIMGSKTPLDFTYDATSELAEVLEFYEITIADNERLPANCLLIAVNGYHTEGIALECATDENGNTTSAAVYATSGEELQYRRLADSLIKLLFRRAFEHFGAAHLPLTATYTGISKEPILNRIADMFKQKKWHKHWFSDSVALCLTSPNNDFVLYSEQPPNEGNWLRIAGSDKTQIARLGKQICHCSDMQFEKWWR